MMMRASRQHPSLVVSAARLASLLVVALVFGPGAAAAAASAGSPTGANLPIAKRHDARGEQAPLPHARVTGGRRPACAGASLGRVVRLLGAPGCRERQPPAGQRTDSTNQRAKPIHAAVLLGTAAVARAWPLAGRPGGHFGRSRRQGVVHAAAVYGAAGGTAHSAGGSHWPHGSKPTAATTSPSLTFSLARGAAGRAGDAVAQGQPASGNPGAHDRERRRRAGLAGEAPARRNTSAGQRNRALGRRPAAGQRGSGSHGGRASRGAHV